MIFKILSALVIIGIVSYIEITKLRNQNMKKEIIIYSLFLLFSSTLFIVNLLEVSIVNPLDGIKFIFEPVGKSIEALFTQGGQIK